MIKLVVSDIDGTLLSEGTTKVKLELFEIIRELKARGIMFAAASGRQYASMRHVFAPVANDIIFIAENGTNVMCREQNISSRYLDGEVAKELVRFMREQKDTEIILSTPKKMYFESKKPGFEELLTGYGNVVERTDDLLSFCERTNKISAYRAYGIEELCAQIKERFADRLNIAIAGAIWVDTMSLDADKGNAIAEIQKMMKITKEETMAFGDNCNDMGMLRQAGESYAVANAHPQLKESAKHIAPPQSEDGVLQVLRGLLAGEL